MINFSQPQPMPSGQNKFGDWLSGGAKIKLYVVGVWLGDNDKKINQPANSKESGSTQPKDTGADFTFVKTVYAETTKEQTQQKGNQFIFFFSDSSTNDICISVCVGVIDYNVRLLMNFFNLLAALWANDAIFVDSLVAMFA